MVESVLYQGRRVSQESPEAQVFEAQAIERGQATLQRSLDRMTSFFAEQNRIQAKVREKSTERLTPLLYSKYKRREKQVKNSSYPAIRILCLVGRLGKQRQR